MKGEELEWGHREMKLRILFSVALIAFLFGFWLFSTKPACHEGEAAFLGPRLDWACVPKP
jgi:hypothetical protein